MSNMLTITAPARKHDENKRSSLLEVSDRRCICTSPPTALNVIKVIDKKYFSSKVQHPKKLT